MKVSRTFYNKAGELMAPRQVDLTLSSVSLGGEPSIEEGFYHRHKVEGATRAERARKVRALLSGLGRLPGYMGLTQREYTVQMGSFVRYGLELLYVVESAAEAAEAKTAKPLTQAEARERFAREYRARMTGQPLPITSR